MQTTTRLLWVLIGVFGVASGLHAYVSARPLWIACVLSAYGTFFLSVAWISNNPNRLPTSVSRGLKSFGFLIAVYGLAFQVAVRELSGPGEQTDLYLAPTDNFTDTIAELYPDRGEPNHMKYIQSSLCYDARLKQISLEACQQYEGRDITNEMLERSRRVYRSGIKDKEEYLHWHAQLLVMLEADPAEIDAAVETWQRHFPHSVLEDPRLDKSLQDADR